jgi:hypothetical protein
MDGHPHLFSPSSLCASCSLRELCGAELTDHACVDRWSPDLPGGEAVSHPLKSETRAEIDVLGGLAFDDIIARPTRHGPLPLYTPQPRNRSAMHGFLHEDVYALKARDVVRMERVIPADEMRRTLGLHAGQRLILVLFDHDQVLEQLWARSGKGIWQIAEAHYDLVVSPSFSTYIPRPRTEFLINVRRSMLYFRALQHACVPAILRIAWHITHDVDRFATWVVNNPCVQMVALDWSTERYAKGWRDQLRGLARFDRLTGRRLAYFINGVTVPRRCDALYATVPPGRVHITNATTQARIPPPRLRSAGDQTGVTFSARCEARRAVIERAAAKQTSPHRKVRLAA